MKCVVGRRWEEANSERGQTSWVALEMAQNLKKSIETLAWFGQKMQLWSKAHRLAQAHLATMLGQFILVQHCS